MKKILSCFLASLMILSLALGMASCKKNEKNKGETFSFMKEKMSKYISLNREDYFGVSVEVDAIPEITEEDVEKEIKSLLERVAEKTVYTDIPVSEGDTVSLYYRGSVDGVDFEGGSNMTDKIPDSLVIGSGSFIPGFEDALIGIVPNTTSFTRIDSGTVKDDYVVYADYSYTYKAEDGSDKTGEKSIRIDLANPSEADAVLAEQIIGKTVGTAFNFDADYDVDRDGAKENASISMKVSFAAIEETTPITVTFPDPYKLNEEFSGKEAVFEVVIKDLSRTEIPELTAETIADKLGYKSAEGAEGDALVAEFYEYIEKILKENREATLKNVARNKLFAELCEKAEVKKYPEKFVSDLLENSKEEIQSEFDYCAQNYAYFPYDTVEEFALYCYGTDYDSALPHEEAMEKYVRKMVLRQMILFYIIQEEDIDFESEEAKQESIASIAQYYAYIYTNMYGQTYTVDSIIEMYGEDALAEEGLVNLMYEKILEVTNIQQVEPEKEAE